MMISIEVLHTNEKSILLTPCARVIIFGSFVDIPTEMANIKYTPIQITTAQIT